MSIAVVVRYKHKSYQNFGVHRHLDAFFDGIAAELAGRFDSQVMWQRNPTEKKRIYVFDNAADARTFKDTLANLDWSATYLRRN